MSKKNKIQVKKIIRNIQTGEVWYELKTKYRNKPVTQTVSRAELTVKGLQELRKFGFPFMAREKAEAFIDRVSIKEDSLKMKEVYNQVGWHLIDGALFFLHKKAIKEGKRYKFAYSGDLKWGYKGTKDEQIEFFNNTVAHHAGLQTVCAISLASAIVGMMTTKDLRFIFHIEGMSTTGKTTSLMLAASMWGNPQISPNGIVRNWHTTENRLVESVGGNNGVLVGLDEFSMARTDNTVLAYILTGGNDKQRMGQQYKSEQFRTVFMSTGEIKFKVSNFGGISVRLFEVKNHQFTPDKETADLILKQIQLNHGFIGFEFVKELSKYSPEDIQSKIEKMTEKVINRMAYHAEKQGKKVSPLFARIAEKIACVAIAAKLAKSKLGMNFDVKKVVDFFILETTVLESGQEQAVEAMEKFMEEFTKNQSKFPEHLNLSRNGVWGRSIFKNGNITEIVVLFNQFVDMMRKLGYPDTTSLIKSLKEKGFIICESGKNYARRKVGDNFKAKVIVINVLAIKEASDIEI